MSVSYRSIVDGDGNFKEALHHLSRYALIEVLQMCHWMIRYLSNGNEEKIAVSENAYFKFKDKYKNTQKEESKMHTIPGQGDRRIVQQIQIRKSCSIHGCGNQAHYKHFFNIDGRINPIGVFDYTLFSCKYHHETAKSYLLDEYIWMCAYSVDKEKEQHNFLYWIDECIVKEKV